MIPVSPETRATLEQILRARPAIGAWPLFPAGPKGKPITKRLASAWLRSAERIAGVPHLDGGTWHPYRRKWATERKGFPTADVMKAGGWKDERSLKTSYQKADEATVIDVVNSPKKLRDKKA